MPARQIEVSFPYTAKVLLPRKQAAVHRRYVAKAWVLAHEATHDEAPLVFGPSDAEGYRDVEEHRWYDGRLWTRERHPSLAEDTAPHDFAWLAAGACSNEGRTHEEDASVRHVVETDRAAEEAKARERYDGYMTLDAELWVPAEEPSLVVDRVGGGAYRVVLSPGTGIPHMRYRLDQVDWMVEEQGEPHRMPNLAVHRPDLLRARTTEAYLARTADDLLLDMGKSLPHQGHDYFAAYHDLREARATFGRDVQSGSECDMPALLAAVQAAAGTPAQDTRADRRSRGCGPHRNLLRRIERTMENREPLPGFMP